MTKTDTFRHWLRAGLQDYGDDRWLFLRELAQNSRDAGAKEIRVHAWRSKDGYEIIQFTDNGRGMRRATARDYLFRLYASSKGGDYLSAGRFGIGFWTVLRYHPDYVRLESRHRRGDWAIVLDSKLQARQLPCRLRHRGTRITLARRAEYASETTFLNELALALEHYCAHLCRATRRLRPLPVYLNKELISRPMTLRGPLWLTFRSPDMQGVVGLAPEPHVSIYAKGLPLWQGRSLDDLTLSPLQRDPAFTPGLCPVFLLNSQRLSADMSRRRPLEDTHFQRLRRAAGKAFERLIADAARSRGNSSLRPRSRQRVYSKAFSVVLVLGLAAAGLLTQFMPPSSPALPNPLSRYTLAVGKNTYTGPSVTGRATTVSLQGTYQPQQPTWFRLFCAETYDRAKGFQQRFDAPWKTYAAQPSRGRAVTIRLARVEPGESLLPCPTGYQPDPASLVTRSGSHAVLLHNQQVGYCLSLDHAGAVSYSCYPEPRRRELPAQERDRLLLLPENMILPGHMEQTVLQSHDLTVPARVALVKRMTSRTLVFADSTAAASRFEDLRQADWLDRVLAAGTGDCDVLNGFAAVLLRKTGVPARLAVGLVGKTGRFTSGLHAWVEYWDNGWQTLDVSPECNGPADTHAADGAATAPQDDNTRQAVAASFQADKPLDVSVLVWIVATSGILAVAAGAWLYRRRRRYTVHVGRDAGSGLADIALHTLLHTKNRKSSTLWRLPMLPCFNHPPMNLKQAFHLAQQGRLFYLDETHPLAARTNSLGQTLRCASPSSLTLFRLIPGALDLAQLNGTKAVGFAPGTTELRLLHCLSLWLRAKSLATTDGQALSYLHADKRLVFSSKGWYGPTLLIPVGWPPFRRAVTRAQSNFSLAAFYLCREIVDQVPWFSQNAAAIGHTVSQQLVRQS